MKILSIESSCDETAAAVTENGRRVLSSEISSQIDIHTLYGGVVPELASRSHIQAVQKLAGLALKDAGIGRGDIDAVAVTYAPGLIGAVLVGVSFAKSAALALGKPLIPVHHIRGHVAANYIAYPELEPPFLCLAISGGNTMLVDVRDYTDMRILGQTRDDAAGEAFDKCAKVLGLPYPGGPWIDKLAKLGDATKYPFAKPNIPGYDYSFSGLKTSFLYTLRDMLKTHGVETIDELAENVPNLREDMCASLQATVVDILMRKLKKAANDLKIREVAVAGGVSANSALRQAFIDYGNKYHWNVFIPPFSFTTDNAAMVCQAGYFKYLDNDFCAIDEVPFAKTTI